MFRQGDILVAEDSRLLLQLLHDALLAHDLSREVVACSSGDRLIERAEERLQQGRPAALYLLDIVMPGVSGLDVGKRLRELEQQQQASPVPILFYSSLESGPEIEAAVEACWPARFRQKALGARADQLALDVVELLKEVSAPR